MAEPKPKIRIYTDGGAKPNPGRGGWGAVFVNEKRKIVRELQGGEDETTNNRMELTAAIVALESLEEPHEVALHTDSKYLQNGITQWLAGWRKRGWLTSGKQPVQNRDLWERLDAALATHDITWSWVRGHSGNRFNERADRLATAGRRTATRAAAKQVQQSERSEQGVDLVHLFAAGTCNAQTGEGGWGAVLRLGQHKKLFQERVTETSANRMQIAAVVEGLRKLKRPSAVAIYTPSDYVRDGATKWIAGWRERNWRTKDKKPVEHRDLWEELDRLCTEHGVQWIPLGGEVPPELAEARAAARGEGSA